MKDDIEIVSALIAIVIALFSFVQFVFKPYFRRKNEFVRINLIVNDNFKLWKELNNNFRGGAIIKNDDFNIVNKYRKKYTTKSDDIKAFLLLNAIQNGVSGLWGKWLNINTTNDEILQYLFSLLDESAGVRLAWRSALILEKLYEKHPISLSNLFPKTDNKKTNDALNLISQKSVINHITKISQKGSPLDLNQKANMVLNEYRIFEKDIEKFVQNQQVVL